MGKLHPTIGCRLGVLALVLACGLSARAAQPVSTIIADFDQKTPVISVSDDIASIAAGRGENGRSLTVTPGGGQPGLVVRFTGVTLPASGHFRCSVMVASTKPRVVVRFIVRRDPSSLPARQVRIALSPADGWKQVDVSLHEWRWGSDSVGDLSEGRELVLMADENADELHLDDVRVDPLTPQESPVGWLRTQAFGDDRAARLIERDGLIVATDVSADAITAPDLDLLLDNMIRGRKFIPRAFGDAVRPIDDGTPPALLIFRDANEMAAFWERMGKGWGATVSPPSGAGYTIYDIATSSYDANAGPNRPTFLHEATHAILAHDVRLLPGTRHSWLQEGAANYLQLAIFPQSLKDGTLAAAFAAEPGARGALFQPMDVALGPSADPRLYAQLATIFGYLFHEKPQWLPVIARSLADGASVADALKKCDTTSAALEEDWRRWGRKWFNHRDPADGVHFPLPREWQDLPQAKPDR